MSTLAALLGATSRPNTHSPYPHPLSPPSPLHPVAMFWLFVVRKTWDQELPASVDFITFGVPEELLPARNTVEMLFCAIAAYMRKSVPAVMPAIRGVQEPLP